MAKKPKASPEAYKSRGMKTGKGGQVGKPESYPTPLPHEISRKKKA